MHVDDPQDAPLDSAIVSTVLTPRRVRTKLSPSSEELPEKLVAAAIRRRLFPAAAVPEEQPGTASQIGRFAVLRKLGEGGMGVVFAGYDDRLERKVAIKLIRSSRHEQAGLRLEREAQALARLSHPNVVQVHEIGVYQGSIFVAMEFIAGRTLRAWKRDTSDWREILAVLIQAGRGLQAAHAAGLVHRDFKPDNVMIGDDARVRVLDFGLARGTTMDEDRVCEPPPSSTPAEISEPEFELPQVLEHAAPDPPGSPADSPADSPLIMPPTIDGPEDLDETLGSGWVRGLRSALQDDLTVQGTVMGTPAYMSPEQHDGQICDALSDQFAFCVTAFECLFGNRPFVGATMTQLHEAVCGGHHRDIPPRSEVPRPIQEAILRGLSVDPKRRWPDMEALLEVFEEARAPARSRLWTALGAGLLGAVVSASVAIAATDSDPAPLCTDQSAALDDSWGPSAHADLERAFGASGLPFAAASLREAELTLDAWAHGWLALQHQACVATHIEHRQSPAILDRQNACLERQQRAFSVIVEQLSVTGDHVVIATPTLLAELPNPDRCTPSRLADPHPLPADPDARKQIFSQFQALARARALMAVGDFEAADKLVAGGRELVERAEHLPLTLEAELVAAERQLYAEQLDDGLEALIATARTAEANQLDELAADARLRAAREAAGEWAQPTLERWIVDDAAAAIARLAVTNDPRAIQLAVAQGLLLDGEGRHGEALEHFEAARAQAARAGLHPEAEALRLHLANSAAALGDYGQAEREYTLARQTAVERWGPESPRVADIDYDLALVELDQGNFDAARSRLDAADLHYRRAHGPGSLPVAQVQFTRAKLAIAEGEPDSALLYAEQALVSYRRELGPDHDQTGDVHSALGVLSFYGGDYPSALRSFENSARIYADALGPDHERLALALANSGDALLALGRGDEALDAYSRALAILERSLSLDHPLAALPLEGRGLAALAEGDFSDAIPDLERALALWERDGGEPHELARTRFGLAQARYGLDPDDPTVDGLAGAAEAAFLALEVPARAAEIAAWRERP